MRQLSTTSPLPDVPAFIAELDAKYAGELEALDRVRLVARQSAARWAGTGLATGYVSLGEDALQNLFEAVYALTIELTARHLGPDGAPAQLDMSAWRAEYLGEDVQPDVNDRGRRRVGLDRQRHDDLAAARQRALHAAFRPSHLWDAILKAYPAQRVEDETRARAAARLVKALALRYQEEVRRVAGRVEISIRGWSEPTWGNPSLRTYSYHTVNMFHGMAESMRVFVAASDLDSYAEGLEQLCQKLEGLGHMSRTFTSRDRASFPGAISVQFFNNAIKIQLPEQVATALNLFIASYGGLD